MSFMKLVSATSRIRHRDALALSGMVVGIGMLFPVFFVPELAFLAVPAFLVLVPSLLFAMQ
jgi:hypothetical protein